jgi:hypothetical protein
VLDIGDEDERVTRLEVGVVGGRVDVVTHDDSPTARVEVTEVEGLPVRVTWDGGTLRVIHGRDNDANLMEMLRKTFESFGRNRVKVSISVPVETRASVSTVSAAAVISGLREHVKVNTVSGPLTVSALEGHIDLNTVSGGVDGDDLTGPATVNTVSGSVTLQGSELPDVKINTVSGDIALDLTSGASRIKSNSVSGDVTVRAPLRGFDVVGNTASGQVVVDGRRLSQPNWGHGGHQRGGGHLREGDGALEIKANAVSGSIVVLRADRRTEPQDREYASPQDAPPGKHPSDPSFGAPTGSASAGSADSPNAGFGTPFDRPSEQPPAHPSDEPPGGSGTGPEAGDDGPEGA